MLAGNEMALRPAGELSLVFPQEKVELLKRTIFVGATDDELELFMHVCKRTGLDPFAKQVYAIKRRQQNDKNEWIDTLSLQTGIDGYRLVADRTERYMPGRDTTYTYDDQNYLLTATAYVQKLDKQGNWHEVAATARWDEYVGKKKDGSPTQMWATKPHIMLGKCAESLALRKAFPAELSGIYTREEMDQANEPSQPAAPQPSVTAKPVESKVVQENHATASVTQGDTELADDDVFADRWINAARERGIPAKAANSFLEVGIKKSADNGKPVKDAAWRAELLANLVAGQFDDAFVAKPAEKKTEPAPAAKVEVSPPAATVKQPEPIVTQPSAAPSTATAPIVNNTKPVAESPITAEAVATWSEFVRLAVESAVVRGVTAESARAAIDLKVISLGRKGKENEITIQTRTMLLHAIRAGAFNFSDGRVDRTKLALTT